MKAERVVGFFCWFYIALWHTSDERKMTFVNIFLINHHYHNSIFALSCACFLSELSSESGPQSSVTDLEAELREIRLSLLMEIEKRKETEEKLNTVRARWLKIREKLSIVGLTLPLDPIAVSEDEEQNDPAEELSQQLLLARFVSNSIGRGTAKAEAEMEMEAKMELKNFEIARLLDRLHYYEAVNREMSQRNQETVGK